MMLQGGIVRASEETLSAQPLMGTLPQPQDSAVASLLWCPKLGGAVFSKAGRRPGVLSEVPPGGLLIRITAFR